MNYSVASGNLHIKQDLANKQLPYLLTINVARRGLLGKDLGTGCLAKTHCRPDQFSSCTRRKECVLFKMN